MTPHHLTITDLLALMRQLEQGVTETLSSGNISIRLPDGTIAIKPSGLSYAECRNAEDIALISLEGTTLAGPQPSSDAAAHLSIYNALSVVRCIIHTHSHYATVMSTLGEPLGIYSTLHADYFGSRIHCMPYLNHRTGDFGKAAVDSGESAMLLARHGALVFGPDPIKAVRQIIALEEVARINYHVRLINPRATELDAHDIETLNSYYKDNYGQRANPVNEAS